GQVQLQDRRPVESLLRSKDDTIGPDKVNTKSLRQLERERLIAKLSQQWEDYQKRPNKEYLSPSTKQHEAAEYLDRWRKKVEMVGNSNYPKQAQARKLSGTLILTVEINRNGTINSIQVNNPSEHRLLNEAAKRFVRDASPFQPFPDQIDSGTDVLVITRAFHFLSNNRLSSSDASTQR
ncbi:MAG: TonB family protein, partial [Arenicella sp.]|nr:TonB family protein [Arenicella sp.]